MKSIETKLYAGIDYNCRPESFWAIASNPLEAALRNVKGQNRREMIRENLLADNLDAIPDYLLNESLDDEARVSRGQIHPMFMGGEYLPDYGDCEVEIARIELKSTTYDVISLRARPIGSRIRYRLVDEYETEYRLPQQTSRRPFSLRELVRFLEFVEQPDLSDPTWSRFGFVLSFNESCLGCGADLRDLRDFTRLDSDYYPDLVTHYSQALEEWYADQREAVEDADRE
jgi:hypothetical protein